MKKLFLLAVLCVAATFSSCSKHDNVEAPDLPNPIVVPDPEELAIAFAESNSLQFDVNETKTVHYTITGGSDNTVVTAEMQTPDDAYTVETTPTSATKGTITITAKTPEADNCVVVTVSDGSQTVTAEIAVSTNPVPPAPEELAIAFAEGNSLQFDVNETKTIHYTITGGNDNTVVKVEMQKSDDAYTVETTPTSATEGTITITAKTPETENHIIITVSDGDRSITAEVAVSTNPIPEELAITFTEGNSLEFNINETKTVHYTITGSSDKTVVKAEMQNPDDAYTVETTPASATEGTITITAQMPSTENCVIVTVSDGNRSITAKIDVTLKASFDGKTAVVVTPGSLSKLLADYVQTRITQLTVIGNLNDKDIATLKNLPNLAILDMENANLEALPAKAFYKNTSLTSVKLPRMLKTIGNSAFEGCSSLTSVTIPDGVTSIGWSTFYNCHSLKSATIPNSVTEIGDYAFYWCSSLTSITLPDGITKIGDYVFYECSSLTSITIPDGVTSIGDEAFHGCGKLTRITIPDSVTSIGHSVFSGGLDWITIGSGITTIWGDTFNGTPSLIYCKAQTPPTIATISTGTYWYEWTLCVPIGCKKAYAVAEYWKHAKEIIEIKFE